MNTVPSKRIMVIDDDPGICLALTRVLELQGYFVEAHSDVKTAVNHLLSDPFDALICDIFMPDMDGLEIIANIRRQRKGLLIIAISGGSSRFEGKDFLKVATMLGADAYLQKPFEHGDLIDFIEGRLDPQAVLRIES